VSCGGCANKLTPMKITILFVLFFAHGELYKCQGLWTGNACIGSISLVRSPAVLRKQNWHYRKSDAPVRKR
jgi:hypothetical protein